MGEFWLLDFDGLLVLAFQDDDSIVGGAQVKFGYLI